MIERFRDIARALVAVLLLGMAGAAAQSAQSPTSPNPGAASHAGSVPTAQAPAQLAGPAGPISTSLKLPRARTGTLASTLRRQLKDGKPSSTAWRALSK